MIVGCKIWLKVRALLIALTPRLTPLLNIYDETFMRNYQLAALIR